MKKNSTVAVGRKQIFKQAKLTIGLDLGDRTSHYCILDEAGNVILERSLPTTSNGIRQAFSKIPRCRIALETGTHSPWVSRQLSTDGSRSDRGACAQRAADRREQSKGRSSSMPARWRGWHGSIPDCWVRCDIAVPKRKFI